MASQTGVGVFDSSNNFYNQPVLFPQVGGTGKATYAVGDLLYASGATTLARLPIGTAGQALVVAAGIPSWATPSSPSSISQSSASRSLNSVFQVSATRNSIVNYSVEIATSATLVGGQTGTVFLEIASNSGFTTNVQELGRFVNGNSVSLAIAITVNQVVASTLTGFIPLGYYVRLRTSNTLGNPNFAYRSGQEVLL